MRILRLISSGSVERFNRKKDELKQLSPIKKAGESVSLYANKIRRICCEHKNAHHFEWLLVLAIIKALCQVSVESFRDIWHPKRLDLDSALSDSAYLSKDSAKRLMVKKGFHYTAILDLAEEAYHSLLDNVHWSPASTVKDTMQQAPSLFMLEWTKHHSMPLFKQPLLLNLVVMCLFLLPSPQILRSTTGVK
jgi:hypothetical protein